MSLAPLVFESAEDGAALLEGWSDEGTWRILLPWPEEVRSLSWQEARGWKELFLELERDVPIADSSAPFLGGWVGFISYECMASEEEVRPRDVHPPEPAMFFARHSAGIAVAPDGTTTTFGVPRSGHGSVDPVQRPDAASPRVPESVLPSALHDSLGGGAHRRAVEQIRAAIRDGDVYQVNLTRTFSVDRACDAADLYRTLTGTAPPRSSAFLRAAGCTIASASPEVLLHFDRVHGIAETRPIKGTVRREGNDDAEIAALLASAKDAAEHLMIVDVARNDLGKIAPPGNVSVSDFRRVRTLEHLHHLESTVRATGLRDRSATDVLAALSPAASITGAPKRAAVGMIRELEPDARGVYCGAIGFIGSRFVELSVAIRTAVVTPDSMRYHAGGGIVWDSDPAAEDEETLTKSAAFLRYAGVVR